MRRVLLLLLLLLLLLVGLFLGGRNAQPVVIDYYLGTFRLSLAVSLVLAFVAGVLLGAIAVWLGTVLRLQARVRRLRRELRAPADPSADRLTADE